jgi:tRNA A37 methylthiotransferase MiaB
MKMEQEKLKIFIDSSDALCKPNSIGVSKIADYVKENKHILTKNIVEADIIIVNTCGFDEKYEKQTCDLLQNHFRNKKPDAKVVSVGCLNIINRELLEKRFPDLNIVNDFKKLDEIIEAETPYDKLKNAYFDNSIFDFVKLKYPQPVFVGLCIEGAKVFNSMIENSNSRKIENLHIPQIIDEIDRDQTKKIFVLIGRGCANKCSYCIIKKAQGDPKSRKIEDILADIGKTYSEGKVLALVGDDCASWGVERGESFIELIDKIYEKFPGIPIDITYINPVFLQKYPNEYLDMFKKGNINSVNISLQSGSDRIIKLMNRKYEVSHIIDVVDEFRRVSPKTMIWAHSLVGFPSETWKEFYMTLKALDHFHFFYAFPFSPRKGTKAAQFEGQLPPSICELRAKMAYARLAIKTGLKVVANPLIR